MYDLHNFIDFKGKIFIDSAMHCYIIAVIADG